MPISGSSAGAAGKATGRVAPPPWLKDAGKSEATTKAPWSKRNATATTASKDADATNGIKKEVKLQSREIKVPVVTQRKTSVIEPIVKPKVKETKPPSPESSEYEEDSDDDDDDDDEEEEEEEEESEEEESGSGSDIDLDEDKHKMPITVKLKPVERPAEVKKSPSVDRAGKFVKPALKKVPTLDKLNKPKAPPATIPEKTVLRPVPQKQFELPEKKEEEKTFVRPPLRKTDSVSKKSSIPPPPPPPKMVPPPPPPPGLLAPKEFDKKPMSETQKDTLERLKTRPRRRPDWSDMMKEVEAGRKLRHVECNDRSQPILKSDTISNMKGQFVYESEKANSSTSHNELLKQIQGGIRLKPTKTNDRSKPVLQGLRKFRKQMTIEEQIQKSESRAQLGQAIDEPLEDSADEMDDIDKLRDDLQSTKQMLQHELRNKEAQERENKRLLAKIQNLEAELAAARSAPATSESKAATVTNGTDDALVKSLKSEAEQAQSTSKLLEKKYQTAAEQLDAAKNEIEEQKRKLAEMEKKMSQSQENINAWCSNCGYYLDTTNTDSDNDKGTSVGSSSRRQSEAVPKESSPEPDFESDENDDDLDEEQKAEKKAKRLEREVKYLRNKLVRLKEKQETAKRERQNIRDTMKQNQVTLKEEKNKFKKLQKEVDKMASMMAGLGDEDDEKSDDEDAESDHDQAKESSEDEDSESEEEGGSGSESDSDSSESEAEDASVDKKKENYEPRIKRHEGRLAALKKGNLLRQANLDRIIDEINKIRDEQVELQHDLDSVLSELG